MYFAGLKSGQLLAALLGATLLTVALYLLRPRQRRVEVPFAALWQAALSDARASRSHWRLRHIWSLLLSLLIACCLVLALGDPRTTNPEGATHTVLLVDCSPSMGALDGNPDRLADARTRVRALLDALQPGDRMLLAAMADTPAPLTAMTDDQGKLREALSGLTPCQQEADFEAALGFARDMLAGRRGPRVVIVSDGAVASHGQGHSPPALPGVAVEWVRVGTGSDNLAVTALAARRHPALHDQSELLVEVVNAGAETRQAELQLLSDGQVVSVEPLQLEPGQRLQRTHEDLSGLGQRVEARVRGTPEPDLLPLDDAAYASMPARRRVKVLAVTEGNLYLQAALLLDDHVEVSLVSPAAYEGAAGRDVVIFDDHVPDVAPGVPALYLHPVPSGNAFAPLEVTGHMERPFFDRLDGDAPILRHIALRDVNLASALKVRTQPGDRVVAASRAGPLIVAGERASVPFVALTFDPRQSDLPLRAAFPLLLLNILDSFRPPDVSFRSGYRVGTRVQLPVDGTGRARVLGPDGRPLAVARSGDALEFTPRHAGFHTLVQGEVRRTLAVNLPESVDPSIAPAASLPPWARASTGPSTPAAAGVLRAPPWMLLVALCGIALAIEWWTYHRRWTA